jgi:hypothetical protein
VHDSLTLLFNKFVGQGFELPEHALTQRRLEREGL